jgi:hypothetical protein
MAFGCATLLTASRKPSTNASAINQGNGQYHHHIHPVCLRAQLDDNLVAVSSGRTGAIYREKAAPWKHSPILGWMFDGYPIYGPYGYSDPTNPNSAVKRLKSGFRLRTVTQRTTLPDWALAHHNVVSQQLNTSQYGPDVSETFPLGRYIEDFEYVQGLGDLDAYNGRFAITPEFPNGTYAYYVTINDDGSPAFPYIIGTQYYGAVTGNNNTAAPANAQAYFSGGAFTQTAASAPQLNSWFTKNSQQEAQVVSGFDPSAGPKTTWPTDAPAGANVSGRVTAPVKADTQSISYTDSTVYVTANNFGSYAMGPVVYRRQQWRRLYELPQRAEQPRADSAQPCCRCDQAQHRSGRHRSVGERRGRLQRAGRRELQQRGEERHGRRRRAVEFNSCFFRFI